MATRAPKIATSYKPKSFALHGLTGISDKTLEMHFKLYEGYVKETNRLTERIAEFLRDGKVDQEEMPAYAEITRRLGFEYNGMVLHELYFGNLQRGRWGEPPPRTSLRLAVEASFGTWAVWRTDFASIGKMRGVGWAVCSQNPETGRSRITGSPCTKPATSRAFTRSWSWMSGSTPICSTNAPSDRAKYIEAFFANVAWDAAEARLRPPSN